MQDFLIIIALEKGTLFFQPKCTEFFYFSKKAYMYARCYVRKAVERQYDVYVHFTENYIAPDKALFHL